MPVLAALLGDAFIAVVTWLHVVMTYRIAVGIALATFYTAGWIAIQAAIVALWIGLGYVTPTTLQTPFAVVAYLLPDNFAICVQALIAAKFARWLWDAQREWASATAGA